MVVVVRTMVYDDNVYPWPPMHATNSGGRTPGSKLPASPSPLLRPDGGGQTLALCLCTGPYQHHTSPKLHTGTSITLSMNCNCGNSMVRRTAWTMGTHLCATTKKTNCTTCATGKLITVSSNWGISFGPTTVWTVRHSLCETTG